MYNKKMPRIHGQNLYHRRNRDGISRSKGNMENEVHRQITPEYDFFRFDFDDGSKDNLTVLQMTPMTLAVEKDPDNRIVQSGLITDIAASNLIETPQPTFVVYSQKRCKKKKRNTVCSPDVRTSITCQDDNHACDPLSSSQKSHSENDLNDNTLPSQESAEHHADNTLNPFSIHRLQPSVQNQESEARLNPEPSSIQDYNNTMEVKSKTPFFVVNRRQMFPQFLSRITSLSQKKNDSSYYLSLNHNMNSTLITLASLKQPSCPETNSIDWAIQKEEPISLICQRQEDASLFYLQSLSFISYPNPSQTVSMQSHVTDILMKSQTCHQILWEMIVIKEILSRAQRLKGLESYFPRFNQPCLECHVEDDHTFNWRVGITLSKNSQCDVLGTLRDVLDSHLELNFGPIPDSIVAALVLQVMEIISTLHQNNVTHNSLTLESFLILRHLKKKSAPTWSMLLVGLGAEGAIRGNQPYAIVKYSDHPNNLAVESSFFTLDMKGFGKILQKLLFRETTLDSAGLFWNEFLHTVSLWNDGLFSAVSTEKSVCVSNRQDNETINRIVRGLHDLTCNDELHCFLENIYSYEINERYLNKSSKSTQKKYKLHSVMSK